MTSVKPNLNGETFYNNNAQESKTGLKRSETKIIWKRIEVKKNKAHLSYGVFGHVVQRQWSGLAGADNPARSAVSLNRCDSYWQKTTFRGRTDDQTVFLGDSTVRQSSSHDCSNLGHAVQLINLKYINWDKQWKILDCWSSSEGPDHARAGASVQITLRGWATSIFHKSSQILTQRRIYHNNFAIFWEGNTKLRLRNMSKRTKKQWKLMNHSNDHVRGILWVFASASPAPWCSFAALIHWRTWWAEEDFYQSRWILWREE